MSKDKVILAIKILIYTSFFVPLLVLPSSFIFPFIVPKILAFRSVVMVMLGFYGLLLILDWKEFKPKFTPVNIAVFLFWLSFGISTFTGVDAYHSFWDNHERMLGFFTMTHYVIYFYICTAVLRTWQEWKTALKVFLIAGTGVMFIGFLQVGNPDLLLNQGSSRVSSTLGNPIYVGGYALFLSAMAILLLIKEKTLHWRWILSAILLLAIANIFFSGTRGDMLALAVAIPLTIFLSALTMRVYPKAKIYLWSSLAIFILLFSVLYFNRQTSFVQNIPAVGRAINTSLSDIKASPRWVAWEIALESWKDKPIFGWGPNNYFYAFNTHYNPKSLDWGYGETWFDNAHNIVLNTMAVQGTFGILVYLLLFGIAVSSLVIAYRKKHIDLAIFVILSVYVVAHLVENVTVFENLTSYIYFMFVLAMISRLTLLPDEKEEKEKVVMNNRIGFGVVSTVGVVVFVLIFIFNIQPARANTKSLEAIKTLNQNPSIALTSVEDALNFQSPHIDDIRSDISRSVVQVAYSLMQNQQTKTDFLKKILDICYTELHKNIELHPLDIRNHMTLSQMAQIQAQLNNDSKKMVESENYLKLALEKSPRRQQLIYSLSMLQMQLGKFNEAIKLLESAITDNSKIAESYWRLAYIYKVAGDNQKALQILQYAQDQDVVFTENENNIIAQIMAIQPESPTTTVKKK